jgi:hypothetical protein
MSKALALAVLACAAQPAGAIVGGSEGGPLAGATLMVLSDRGGVCTGIVLERDVVLTAGHCVSGVGQVRIHWRTVGEPVLREPAAIVPHPGFNEQAVAQRKPSIDLALIRLKEPLPDSFAAANLLSGTQPRAGQPIVVGGYGVAREGDARSTGTFRSATLAVTEPYGPGKLVLWASNAAPGGTSSDAARGASSDIARGASSDIARGACTGDSGGVLARSDDAIAAVTTWASGSGKAKCGNVTQGILVAPQRSWIDVTLKSWGRRANWVE